MTRVTHVGTSHLLTVKQEYLAAIIFDSFSNMAIWQIINLVISNTGIPNDWDVFIFEDDKLK